MTMHNADPSGIQFNGEPATVAAMEMMEGLAIGIVAETPAERSRDYIKTTIDGAVVQFRSVQFEEPQGPSLPVAEVLSIALSREEDEKETFEIAFSPDNLLLKAYCEIRDKDEQDDDLEDPLVKAASIAHELLESADLDPNERALVRHMRHIALFIRGQSIPANANMSQDGANTVRPVASMIADLVNQNTRLVTERREFGHAFDDDHTITIVQHVVTGEIETEVEFALADEPRLQIEFEDRTSQLNYCYTLQFGGGRKLEVYSPADLLEHQYSENGVTEEDIMVGELAEAAGMHVPGEADIAFMTEKVIGAIEAELAAGDFTYVEDILTVSDTIKE